MFYESLYIINTINTFEFVFLLTLDLKYISREKRQLSTQYFNKVDVLTTTLYISIWNEKGHGSMSGWHMSGHVLAQFD